MTARAGQLAALAAELSKGAAQLESQLIELVCELTAIDAPSGSGAETMGPASAAFARILGRFSRSAELLPTPRGDLIEFKVGPAGDTHVLVLGHYDTVWPAGTAAERPAKVVGDSLYGPGTYDMRGGIAAAFSALSLLGEARLPIPVRFLLTPDEETGSACSRERIVELGRAAQCALVLEPPLPAGGIKTSRSGWTVYELTVSGVSAHAGLEPERGVSAIDELCDTIVELRGVADADVGTTINVGVISGGTLPNLVAAQATAQVDVRTRSTAEDARVLDALASLRPRRKGAGLKVKQLHSRPAMERSPATALAYQHIQRLARALGQPLGEGHAGGTSDANLIAPLGLPVIDGLGPDGAGAHARDERILISSLVERTALLALLLAYPPGRAHSAVA